MIAYRMDRWFDPLTLLFRVRGSVLPETLVVCLLGGFWAFSLRYWDILPDADVNGGGLMYHPNTLIFFLQSAGIIMAFFANQAYGRFWEARTHIQAMSTFFASAASCALAFEAKDDPLVGWGRTHSLLPPPDDPPAPKSSSSSSLDQNDPMSDPDYRRRCQWRARILHLVSVLHAVCIQYLYSAHDANELIRLDILGGFSDAEAREIAAVDDHAFLVCHWISMETAKKAVDSHPLMPPVLARIMHEIASGMQSYNNACKVEDTLVPMLYIQILILIDVAVLLVVPVVIACFIINNIFTIITTTLVVGTFHAIFRASQLMMSPCGNRPNDVPLINLHKDFIGRLHSLIDPSVAQILNDMQMKAQITSGMLEYATIPVVARQMRAGTLNVLPSPTLMATTPDVSYEEKGVTSAANLLKVFTRRHSQKIPKYEAHQTVHARGRANPGALRKTKLWQSQSEQLSGTFPDEKDDDLA